MIDLGLHVAGGIDWNGREVDQGIVVLIALEGGKMIDNRIIAARNHLGLPPTVPLVVVQRPIDLRTKTVDAERLTNTIQRAIADCTGPMPVRLVIIDTMSRALNGGSEGAEDTSALLANVDHVRHETCAAILFVAHCGKDAAKGIRGWSGVRAAIDVEIETTKREDGAGFVAEVTKERDLPTGDRFAFSLDVVEMGRNSRGKTVTTSVVVPAEAPAKKKADGRHRRLADKPAVMLMLINSMMAQQGEPMVPILGMPTVTGMPRSAIRQGLIAAGWFDEGVLTEGTGERKLRKSGYTDEHNALMALKRRGLVGFDQRSVWLP